MRIEDLRPAVVIADSGVCEGIFMSYEAALGWANQHGMGISNVRGGVPFIDVQWPQYGVGLSHEAINALGELEKMRQIERGITEATLDILTFPKRRHEIVWFTPDEIQASLDKNLAAGLRQLADAIEGGAIDGKVLDCRGNGLTAKGDDRAHVLLRIDLAAPIRQTGLQGCQETTIEPSFTCPKCSAVSYNPNDVRERYCGACHEFAK